MASSSGSIIRLKIEGDNRQPCLVPFEIENGLERRLEE